MNEKIFRSKRRGFQRYIIGQLKECASRFFQEDIFVRIQDDISSNECKKNLSFSNKIFLLLRYSYCFSCGF
jgi:hypothetical protein